MNLLIESYIHLAWRCVRLALFIFASLGITACGGGGSSASSSGPEPEPQAPTPSQINSDAWKVFMLGNSHVASHAMPDMLASTLSWAYPQQQVLVERAPNYLFLQDHLSNAATQSLFDSQQWSHVILQGQPYSQSFSQKYSTEGAEKWIGRVKVRNATPILFPEHPRFGTQGEADYVYQIHQDISTNAAACVAPIPYAWEEAMMRHPDLSLHAADGNHAAYAGAVLTVFVLFEVITGQPVETIGGMPPLDLDAATLANLASVASYALANYPACE